MKIQTMKIADLHAAPYNPRRISERAMKGLIESVKRFGPGLITVNERTGHVVGGHQRIKALAALGVKETEVQVVDLDESEEKVMNVTLNNPYIAGEFTEDLGPMLAAMEAEIKEALALTELELSLEIEKAKEFDETAADGMELCNCPTCGHEHARKK